MGWFSEMPAVSWKPFLFPPHSASTGSSWLTCVLIVDVQGFASIKFFYVDFRRSADKNLPVSSDGIDIFECVVCAVAHLNDPMSRSSRCRSAWGLLLPLCVLCPWRSWNWWRGMEETDGQIIPQKVAEEGSFMKCDPHLFPIPYIIGTKLPSKPIYQVTRPEPWFQIYRELEGEGSNDFEKLLIWLGSCYSCQLCFASLGGPPVIRNQMTRYQKGCCWLEAILILGHSSGWAYFF